MIITKIIQKALETKGSYNIKTQGFSMQPTINEGESIELIKPYHLKPGDIILFEVQNTLVLHRIIEIYDQYIVTKGDNHDYSDHYISKKNIIAKTAKFFDDPKPSNTYNYKFKGITFVYWNIENISDKLVFHLKLYGINLVREQFPIDKIHLAVIPGAEKNCDVLKDYIDKYGSDNIALHFNAKISNTQRDGFLLLESFKDYFRIGTRISNFILDCEDSMFVVMGKLI
ncbi:MAG: hypothetical protein F8N38_23495 [Hungatella sp.]|nr:hypothetical protein [Hungatella sp.]